MNVPSAVTTLLNVSTQFESFRRTLSSSAAGPPIIDAVQGSVPVACPSQVAPQVPVSDKMDPALRALCVWLINSMRGPTSAPAEHPDETRARPVIE